MDEGRILLVRLSPQLEEASRLIGAAILGRLLMAAFSRSDTREGQRRPFMIYADEYQRFATTDFAVFLAEARKSGVATTIANQTLEQLSDLNRATALQAGSLVVFRVSGEDSKVLAPSFDATPQPALVGEEPILAPVTDIVGHLVRRGHANPTVATFVTEYLQPLEALLKSMGQSHEPFVFGCMHFRSANLIEGRRLLNECLFTAMQTGRADLFIHPAALLTLGGAADDGITQLFYDHKKEEFIPKPDYIGLEASANWLGRPELLDDPQAVAFLLKKYAKKRYWDTLTQSRMVYPGPAFLRMLRALRGVIEILAREPVLVATGQYQPKYQLRTYQDQENLVANTLSQLPNYHAKVRLLSGEHLIKTNPAPALLSEQEVEALIRTIKEQMLREGYTTPAAVVEEEVRKRHEALRRRPAGDGHPHEQEHGNRTHTNGNRRSRPQPPPDPA
jgi:hypothetical protein